MGAAIYERMEAAVYRINYKLDYADQELNGHIRLFSSRTMLNGATTEHEVYRQTMARLDDIFAKHKERRAAYKKKIAKFDEQLDRLDAVCQMDEAMEAASMPISGDVDMDAWKAQQAEFHKDIAIRDRVMEYEEGEELPPELEADLCEVDPTSLSLSP